MNGTEQRTGTWRATAATAAVLTAALAGVATVWVLAAWWSFAEQNRGAGHLGFEHPAVLPWTLDGLGVSLALVALAAALDGRPAPLARLGVLLALGGSVWANRLGVQLRSPAGHAPDDAMRLAAVAPLSAFVAFEVILSAVRRLVMRWRGLPAPAPIPALRPVRLLLAPWRSWCEWRADVLAVTARPLISGDPVTPRAGSPVPPVDATQGGSHVHTPPPGPPAVAADSGPVDAPAGVHRTAPVLDNGTGQGVGQPAVVVPDARLDSDLDNGGLDKPRVPVRRPGQPAVSRRKSSPASGRLSRTAGRRRSPDYTEAVRRMVGAGVPRSTANARADRAENDGTLTALLAEYPVVRAVGDP